MSGSSWFGVGVALACVAVLSVSAPRGDEAAASYVFATAPVNAKGVKGMADLRGKPVLIDFWGTH